MDIKNKIALVVIGLACMLSGKAQNIIVKPYLQNAFPTAMTVMWEVDNTGTGMMNFGTSPFEMNNAVSSVSDVGSGSTRIHTAIISGIIPGTKYYYKVEMAGGQQSQLYTFVTPYDVGAERSTQLVAISDMQRDGSHPDKFREIIEDGIIDIINSDIGTSLNDLEAIMIPGDLVATGGNYSQWKDHFFNPADSLFPYVPVYPVPGNHEYFGGGLPNFIKYFSLPSNGPPGLSDQCWYKDISNVRIIGLNSNSGSADKTLQLNWLGELLDATCMNDHVDFVFAQLHHPFKSELWTPGENEFTGMVIDSLEQFSTTCNKASIHFFGHTHAYSRGQSRDHKHLWINVATSGGAIDNWGEFPNADYEEFVKSQDEYGFVMLDIQAGEEPQFTLKRYSRGDQDATLDNVLRDEITIYKNEWKPSKPVNVFPLHNDTISNPCLELKGSQFSGITDTIQAAHWQIALGGNFEDSLVTSSWLQNENYYFEVNLQENDDLTDAAFTSLPTNEDYHWRVRYRDQNLEWSPWSDSTMFHLTPGGDTLSGNLIQNEGGENGTSFWSGDIEALLNAECASVSPYEGDYNFAVGGVCANESSIGFAKQSISLIPYISDIIAGEASIDFGGYMRNFGGSDVPEMYVEFYDNGSLILSTPPISNASGVWTRRQDLIEVPTSANECRMVLKGIRNAGTDNDSYFDHLWLYVMETVDCQTCYGDSGIDLDMDGFCDDLDCNDNDADVFPGNVEICDLKDNNCDGIAELSDTISWTGNGGNNKWSDPANWNQLTVPLPCQYVLINLNANVTVDSSFSCKGIRVATGNMLTIGQSGYIFIDAQNENIEPSVIVDGTLIVNGRCDVKSSSGIAFEVYGLLINSNKMNASQIQSESIIVRSGGRFESLGTTIIK